MVDDDTEAGSGQERNGAKTGHDHDEEEVVEAGPKVGSLGEHGLEA